MKLSSELTALETRLGHKFRDPDLLVSAVTHSSVSSSTRPHNERLEFLGDRVLGLVIAEELLHRAPDDAEGVLAPRFNALVRKETCASMAQKLDIGAAMKLGKSEMVSGGRRKSALLANAMEAVIAAVYLDAGLNAAKEFIIRVWGEQIDTVKADARDAKTRLQELVQAKNMKVPEYEVTGRSGPDHAPEFTVEVRLQSGERAVAKASSKRAAEQKAAEKILAELS